MLKFFKIFFIVSLLSSCAIEQDYFFEKNGEVKMNVSIDMSALMKNLPPDSSGNKNFNNIQDSITKNNEFMDSMEYYGIKDFKVDFDTTTYKLTSNMRFKDVNHFEKFMNKDREKDLKPINVSFSKSSFSVKNCASLISNEMLKGLNQSKEGDDAEEPEMDMSSFFTFKTTYHFPYEIDKVKSESGNGLLSEDKKSISFDNTLDDFTNPEYNGDLEVNFK